MSLKRSSIGLLPSLLQPIRQSPWPLCLTCGRPIDSEELVEGYPGQHTFARVLVRHHGAEELREFDFGSVNWDDYDLRRAMKAANFFDPMKLVEQPTSAGGT